jgi:2-keto-4-pentenoate hydratase/2-oxohepta-3-ene-1,7-dioic acid hydratase in catechol pathway
MVAVLQVECVSKSGSQKREIRIERLIVAGWTGRNIKAVEEHIEELAKLGVPRPATVPIFYRCATNLLTNEDRIQVMGGDSSGEVEPVVYALDDGLWVGVGSDHTDRKAETQGITLAKQLCSKPVSPTVWRFDEIKDHWDSLKLRSYATKGGERRLYQEGTAAVMHPADELIRRSGARPSLPAGTVMFCGTMAVKGGIAPADRFEMELEDPVLGRTIRYGYAIETLPVAG